MNRHRHDLSVPGQLEIGQGKLSPVTISELSEDNFRIQEDLPELDSDTSVLLWLGAIGPLRAHVSPQSRTFIEFDGAIHSAIVEHFNV